jgi:hypothetical protein
MPQPDPYDAVQDARSESLYEEDPRAEPQQWEVDESRYEREHGGYILDEDSGFRG